MNRTLLTLAALAALSGATAWAHDEGHGPKLNDQPKEGGLSVQPIVDAKDAAAGPKAALVYKSELVPNSEDGTLSLYLYDKDMNKLPVDKFARSVDAKIGPMKKNPKWKAETFALEAKGDHFAGKAPKIKAKPYFIDFTLTEGTRKLLTAYDNLDWSPNP